MAKNKIRIIALTLAALALFLAGGWFFTSLPYWRAPKGEVEELYNEDGEAFGIFDNIPAEDLAAAETAALYGLNQEVVLPEESAEATRKDGSLLPSQIALTDVQDIAGIAPVEKKEKPETQEGEEAGEKQEKSAAVPLMLSGDEKNAAVPQDISALPDRESKITLVAAPVEYTLIKNTQQYKKFKTRARGKYPSVDFTKNMLVVLESQSNLPDKVFEIEKAEIKDGKLHVSYRVNIFGLDEKINTHTVAVVNKTEAPVELEQIL